MSEASNPMRAAGGRGPHARVQAATGGGNGPETAEDGRCTARTRSGGRCRGMAVTGATVCRMHGGAAPQVRAAAQRREATAEFLRTYGDVDGPQEDPAVVVSRLIRQASGHVAWLLERVQETEAEALVWGMNSEVERQGGEFPGVDTMYSAAVNGWVRLYGEERDRLLKMCDLAARMGVNERLVTIAEVQTKIMFEAMNRAFDALELTPEQQRRVPDLMAGLLRDMAVEGRPELPAE
ncbi:HGGxSTG domain-containing protein [Streptomyces sp. NPDC088400]|uniref:HGGxSTG domain-containing protein n=1 Tax=Streptomyces sp. NPDC088400 TaxID=3365861 RepID=UPI003829A205